MNPGLCLFPEYLVKDIETPLFLLNSLYDSWQIFERNFLKSLQEIGNSSCTGMFINSCYLHCYIYSNKRWNCSPEFGNKTMAQVVGDWYFDRNSSEKIDTYT
ncbi:Pectin acetylesterase 8 [Abeliophyllum distichum]|uniref:Pectin acetylesterase n=1 Tax=Abeliophyllum distichum TaxID=126358 RepID=A0ABD1TX99_9LAMI